MPTRLTMSRVLRRMVTGYGRVRPDAAGGCPERFDAEFLHFARTWNGDCRARNLHLIAGFPGRTIVPESRTQQRRLERDLLSPHLGTG